MKTRVSLPIRCAYQISPFISDASATAVGQRILLNRWTADGALDGCAFVDVQVYVTSMRPLRDYLVFGDFAKSGMRARLWFRRDECRPIDAHEDDQSFIIHQNKWILVSAIFSFSAFLFQENVVHQSRSPTYCVPIYLCVTFIRRIPGPAVLSLLLRV